MHTPLESLLTEPTATALLSRTVPWFTKLAGSVCGPLIRSNMPLLVNVPVAVRLADPLTRITPWLAIGPATEIMPPLSTSVPPAATVRLLVLESEPTTLRVPLLTMVAPV